MNTHPISHNGLHAATEILKKHPAMPILFITGHEKLQNEIDAIPFFRDKKFSVLIKPLMLAKMENTTVNLTKRENTEQWS